MTSRSWSIRSIGLSLGSVALALCCCALALGASSAGRGFHLVKPKVSPGKAFFDGKDRASLAYSFAADGKRDVKVQVLRIADDKVVASWTRRNRKPGHRYRVSWGGLQRNGSPAGDGAYAFKVGTVDGVKRGVGRFEMHGYEFPVDGPHGTRGAIGAFHAPRSGGRTHEGFDITADCGTPIRAARGGTIRKLGYDPSLYGNYVLINGRKTKRDTFYAHMLQSAPFSKGDRVATGEGLGRVGQTGNAAGTPCHLHFELHDRGTPIDPEPRLRRWDHWS
jgi:murein DD-endopeptidase MepM/ murein hydrolase activator NlpD